MKPSDILFIVAVVGLAIASLFSSATQSGQSGTSTTTRGGFFSLNTQSGQTRTEEKPLTEKQIGRELDEAERSVEEIAEQVKTLEENKNASVYKDLVTMRISGRGSTDPKKEYATLQASSQNKTPIKITGWKFKSLSTNKEVTIGQAIPLFFSQNGNLNQDVYLKPDDEAIIVTGKGNMNEISFQVNKCSGYHSQFFSFSPSLQSDCPRAEDEPNNIPTSPVNDSCFDFIESFPQCRVQTEPLPKNFTFECRNFILETMTYASCVNLHKNDRDFYSKEWRIFLGRDESLWKNRRETVVLLDHVGKIVDTVTFD